MEDKSHIHLNNMLYSCVDEKRRGNEQFVPEHALGYIISGEAHLQTNRGLQILKEGSIGLIRRNQLVKSVKVPSPGGDFKSINIFLTQDFLRKYSAEHKLAGAEKYTGEPMRLLPDDPFIKGYFDSEAVELILKLDPEFHDFLFDFSEPYKIDLEAYMNQNFMYNVPAIQFARLTGRSLASFKRDFEKIFQASPGQWLQQKRLKEAYYLISEKGRKPSDVYLDVGFENLSHFSYTFKKSFGVAPSMV